MPRAGTTILRLAVSLVLTACGGPAAGPSASPASGTSPPAPTSRAPATTLAASTAPAAATTAPAATPTVPTAAGDPNDLLARIRAAGRLVVSTRADRPPQSRILPDGSFEGFDIDVATEIGKRLGVDVVFVTPEVTTVETGGWGGAFDVSIGSVTFTEERTSVLDFSDPYSHLPAQMSAVTDTGITTLEALTGRKVCIGEATIYQQWIDGTLKLGDGSSTAPVPNELEATTYQTDVDCAQVVTSGRHDFEGWLTSSPTVAAAIKDGVPFTLVGDPVFQEPRAVATDRKGSPHAELQAELVRIIEEMHVDGTLSTLSRTWYDGEDLTTP